MRSITRLRGIPPEMVRFHTCYGINEGPRVHDAAARQSGAVMLKINAGAYSFEAANAASRARVPRVGKRQAAGRQVADSWRHHPRQQHRRASRADRRAHDRATPRSSAGKT